MDVREKAIRLYAEGYTYREIEKMPGMPSRSTVCRWVRGDGAAIPRSRGRRPGLARRNAARPVEGEGNAYDGFDGDKEEQIRQLQLENDILRGMVEVLKGASLGQLKNREKSILIEWLKQKTDHPLRELTASLRISKSSYEYWRIHLHDCDARDAIGDDEFASRLDGWLRFYSEKRLKAFRENGRTVYDTIDDRRKRLGLAS